MCIVEVDGCRYGTVSAYLAQVTQYLGDAGKV